ncbi:sugar transferase [Cellulomonas humilata]|uniref:Lipopolysaccharide/colanic/teichoic acid biosynthesis glycosyltransferase n=1 Tax=Cellulomonas humilata TaxID=144055 RepID=A0ABU0EG15_9CELL|nr:sugar transferase [Cellulomonas humilata]MDQ0374221.1 lipopolysaccharide/colanic/teichoic acid biosynthesis glycosyltransferase [Cellulomonas humilata]
MSDTVAYRWSKRTLDVVVAGGGLVLLSPLLLVVAVVVRVGVGSPILFRQVRPGRGARPFTLLKFRTMRGDGSTGVGSDAARITRVGAALRATSLDELPSLVNVVRGEMSLVGPRPLLVQYLDRYTPEQARRHEVKPGVTGLAQVRGRNALDWDTRLSLDVEYVDTCSFGLDLGILLESVSAVVRRHGIVAPGTVSAIEFRGSDAGGRT